MYRKGERKGSSNPKTVGAKKKTIKQLGRNPLVLWYQTKNIDHNTVQIVKGGGPLKINQTDLRTVQTWPLRGINKRKAP